MNYEEILEELRGLDRDKFQPSDARAAVTFAKGAFHGRNCKDGMGGPVGETTLEDFLRHGSYCRHCTSQLNFRWQTLEKIREEYHTTLRLEAQEWEGCDYRRLAAYWRQYQELLSIIDKGGPSSNWAEEVYERKSEELDEIIKSNRESLRREAWETNTQVVLDEAGAKLEKVLLSPQAQDAWLKLQEKLKAQTQTRKILIWNGPSNWNVLKHDDEDLLLRIYQVSENLHLLPALLQEHLVETVQTAEVKGDPSPEVLETTQKLREDGGLYLDLQKAYQAACNL